MKRTLLNKRRAGSFWTRWSGQKKAEEHDRLVECLRKEQEGMLVHIHDKPFLSEGWRQFVGIVLAAGLVAFSMVAGYYATHHDESEAYPYQPEGDGVLIP